MPVDKTDQRVREMFGEIAPRYDLLNHLLSLNIDRFWRWRTVRLAPPQNGAPILDVCTGTGDLALAYQKRCDPAVPIVAADFCPEMLQIGERKKRRRAVGAAAGLLFVTADTQQLPFADDRFQLVTVAFGLRNVADTDRGLAEMTRVCARGGRVVILEFSMPRRQPLRGIYGWYFRYVLPRIGQWLASNRSGAYNYLPESVGEFPEGKALAERMRSVGLQDVRHTPLTLGIATLYIGTKA
jgi:demethylmenaquinone methyltransferase/2-methoxy-6-polyprenyl-1,4-benzoquinol methylase